jgi:serine/threonine protein kinase
MLHSRHYSSPVDIWAIGCILAELFTLSPLFPGTSELDQLFKVCNILGPPLGEGDPEEDAQIYGGGRWSEGLKLAQIMGFKFQPLSSIPISKVVPMAAFEAIKLMAGSLKYDPFKRPAAAEMLKSLWFQELWDSRYARPFNSPQEHLVPTSKAETAVSLSDEIDALASEIQDPLQTKMKTAPTTKEERIGGMSTFIPFSMPFHRHAKTEQPNPFDRKASHLPAYKTKLKSVAEDSVLKKNKSSTSLNGSKSPILDGSRTPGSKSPSMKNSFNLLHTSGDLDDLEVLLHEMESEVSTANTLLPPISIKKYGQTTKVPEKKDMTRHEEGTGFLSFLKGKTTKPITKQPEKPSLFVAGYIF